MTKPLNPKSRTPKAGAVVYLAVYPSRDKYYGGEWDVRQRDAISTAESWQYTDGECDEVLIVKAKVVSVSKRLKPIATSPKQTKRGRQ